MTAQLLQRLPVVGAAAHGSEQAETVDVGAQMPIEVGIPVAGRAAPTRAIERHTIGRPPFADLAKSLTWVLLG